MNDTRISEFIRLANPVIAITAADARVAASFLPKHQLPRTAKQVTADRVNFATGTVDDIETFPLAEIWTRFAVDWQQLAEDDFQRALILVRVATQAYSRLEDRLLFLGQRGVPPALVLNGAPPLPQGARVDRGSANAGLSGVRFQYGNRNRIYEAVAAAHAILEEQSIAGPFAMAMGPDLADWAHRTPAGFVESPRRRIENLLGSKVHRASVLPPWDAILVGGALPDGAPPSNSPPTGPVDRAVAVDPELRDLGQSDNQGRHEFWVVGSLALRLKDRRGVIRIDFSV
jgi:hypothetical protein